jgi:NADH:ubiquinone oxidoreductase subunit 6 (subunit J)
MEQFELLNNWAQANVETFMLYLLAAIAIPCAFSVLFDRAIIRSGFFLIGVFGAISGLFLILQAQFLALAQIMIYAVGITLVVVIALMLTNARLEKDFSSVEPTERVGGLLVAALFFLTIYLALRSETWPVSSLYMRADNVQQIGIALLTNYALPFEFASVLLLAALMGAILLAKADPKETNSVAGSLVE